MDKTMTMDVDPPLIGDICGNYVVYSVAEEDGLGIDT